MVTAYQTEIDKSNAQFYGVWKKLGGKFASNEALELPGVTISWPGAKWPMLNVVGLSCPVADPAELEAFAYVGYKNGRAVTTAATYVEDNSLYVGWVATLPKARRNGYAEAVMRHSLEEAAWSTGLSRTVLHATELGYPIYRAMGFRQVAFFHVYFPQSIVNEMSNLR